MFLEINWKSGKAINKTHYISYKVLSILAPWNILQVFGSCPNILEFFLAVSQSGQEINVWKKFHCAVLRVHYLVQLSNK